ncbi:MAG: prephenate dehydrogenase/arogenate dehydrogenase family protein [Mycobacteriales bacterium]
MIGQVGIVGAGLIGASIGMALERRQLPAALLVDSTPGRAQTAAALRAGQEASEADLVRCDHIILAVPPSAVASVLLRLQGLNLHATFSDVASVKTSVLAEAKALDCDMSRFCGAHPIAGRERGGPTAAIPELFDESIWVSTPTPETSPDARAAVSWLAEQCGGRAVEMSAAEHDRALAVVSHLPQFVASLLAAQLPAAGGWGPLLAGRGFRDTTRLADSDPELWVQIAAANRVALAECLTAHEGRVAAAIEALEADDTAAVGALLALGRDARQALPTKASRTPVSWTRIGVVLQDRPGELARLFAVAGDAGVNIEDVSIDHAADHPVGLVILDVADQGADTLSDAVRQAGWHALTLGHIGT